MESLCMRIRTLYLQRAACSIKLPTPLHLNNAHCYGSVYTMLVAHKHKSSRFNWRRIDWSDPEVTVFTQTVDDGSMRLDRLLREQTGFPQSKVQHLIVTRKVQAVRNGVLLSKDETHARLKVIPGDEVAVYGLKHVAKEIKGSHTKFKYKDFEYSMEKPIKNKRRKLDLEILYKDDHLLVINKPWNLVVQGGESTESYILPDHLEDLKFEKPDPPRIVHRLDKLTTGVLLLARTRVAAIQLSELFREHKLIKEYVAQIAGWPRKDEGIIDAPLCIKGAPPMESVQLAEPIDKEQWSAVTKYQVVDRREDVHCRPASFIRLWPQTGRKHQLRAHCAHVLRAPITGDRKYGYIVLGPMKVSRKGIVPKMGHYLHLHKITLPAGWLDPSANIPPTPMVITAPLPLYLQPMEPMLEKLDKKAATETAPDTLQV